MEAYSRTTRRRSATPRPRPGGSSWRALRGPRPSSTGSAASISGAPGTSPCTATRRSSRRASPPSASSAVHSATSRTGFGNTPVQIELERQIAAFFGTEDSIHFVSGYLDNLFLVQALKDKVGAIFIDETAHFSIRDAVYSALKPVYTFKHRDPEDLARQLKAKLKAGDVPLVMSDGIFPTFGVIAPVPEYLKVLEPYNGYLCLDDSHAVGHLGPERPRHL